MDDGLCVQMILEKGFHTRALERAADEGVQVGHCSEGGAFHWQTAFSTPDANLPEFQ